ncbi:MAG: signal peptidase I [Fimbriimonadaceae bacterium]
MNPLLLLAQAPAGPSDLVLTIDRIARMPMSQVVIGCAILTAIRVLAYVFLKNVSPHERFGAKFGILRFLNDATDAVVYAGIVVFLIVRPFGIQTFFIPSGSMVDTLLVNDYIVANKLIYRFNEPQPGDIIVFKPPKRALMPGQGETDFIKRLIGKPFDLVEWKDKKLYRNGEPVEELYVDYTDPDLNVLDSSQWPSIPQANFKLAEIDGKVIPVQYWGDIANAPGSVAHVADEYAAFNPDQMREMIQAEPVRVPEGMYLFMGDNRNGSFDGRGWGLVPRADIIGRSEFIFFPLARWRGTR